MKDLLIHLIQNPKDIEFLKNIKEFDVEIVCETYCDYCGDDPSFKNLLYEAIQRYWQIVWDRYSLITKYVCFTCYTDDSVDFQTNTNVFKYDLFLTTYQKDLGVTFEVFVEIAKELKTELENFSNK